MRAQRRHELQQNKLALWVADVVQRVRPHLKKILLGTTVLAAAIVIVVLLRAFATRGRSAAWETFFTASGGELDNLADESPGSKPGQWAAVKAGDMHLAIGCQLLFTNKENAASELRKAEKDYTTAIESSGKAEADLREQAYYGRAKTYEALAGADLGNRDDMDKAIADYEELRTHWPNGPYGKAAERQLAVLRSNQGKKFYEKFAAYRPKPPAAPKSGKLPLDILNRGLGEEPDSTKQPLLPDFLKGQTTPAEKPAAGTPTPGKGQVPASEPSKTAPAKPEPSKPEPSKAPAVPGAAKTAPAKPEAAKPEPAKSEPAKSEPGKKS